jgi:septum formation protein
MKQFILASGSQGRKEILKRSHVDFTVDVSNYEEDMTLDMPPADLAICLSQGKAMDVAARHSEAVVLGADSFAIYNGELLGKPHTLDRAKEMLTMLSGQCHTFVTGFTIIDTASGKTYSSSVESTVYFTEITPSDIDGYLAKENVLNKAGAYTIQGLGSAFITKIDGSFSNVIGLPLMEVAAALKDFGVNFLA